MLQTQAFEFGQLIQVLDFSNFVFAQVKVGQVGQLFEIFDLLKLGSNEKYNNSQNKVILNLTLNLLSPNSSIVKEDKSDRCSICDILFEHKKSFSRLTKAFRFSILDIRLKLMSSILKKTQMLYIFF